MIDIKVFVQKEQVITDTAKLIGWNEKSVRDKFKQSQMDGRVCVFEARVTAEQWAEIQRRRVKV